MSILLVVIFSRNSDRKAPINTEKRADANENINQNDVIPCLLRFALSGVLKFVEFIVFPHFRQNLSSSEICAPHFIHNIFTSYSILLLFFKFVNYKALDEKLSYVWRVYE